jgi:hypothetical protein
MNHDDSGDDGRVRDQGRLADQMAIQDLATAYAYAVDDRDWTRWEALFLPDAQIDYTAAGGIAGSPAELAAWMPGAMAVFTFCLHTTSTHEIRFTGPDRASGRVHVFNRNGLEWEGQSEVFDVGAVYHDAYARVGSTWRFASRIEHTTYFTGGAFADFIRAAVAASGTDRPPSEGTGTLPAS